MALTSRDIVAAALACIAAAALASSTPATAARTAPVPGAATKSQADPKATQAESETAEDQRDNEDDEDDEDDGEAANGPADDMAIAYKTTISGVEDKDLRQLLRRASQLVGLAERRPPSLAALRRRASDDVQRLLSALRSEGYYAAGVDYSIDEQAEPMQVTVELQPGEVYLLSDVDIVFTRDIAVDAEVPRTAGDLGLEPGVPARAPEILAAQRRLLQQLERQGYPLAQVADRKTVVNHDLAAMDVRWRIEPGERVRFGDWHLDGLETIEHDHVRDFRKWQPEAVFDQRLVAETRRELMETGLFSNVVVERGEPADGEMPLTFRFTERKHRSIGFAARFSTSEGPSGTAFWEHRNLFGRNETLRLSLNLGTIEQSLRGDFAKPRFLREDQALISSAELRREESDAFDEEAIAGFVGLERELSEFWIGSLGTSAEFARTEDNEGQRDFLLFGLPATLARDSRDDPLNPTEGSRLALESTPYAVTIAETGAFLRNVVGGSIYQALDERHRYILAARARVGSIIGAKTETIPASKRFYAGGGGSVRGFNFQEVGPLDDQDDPLGGRSLIEMSLEMRVKVTDTIGVVPFVDAGNVFDDPYPNFSEADEPLLVAAGLGARYFTPIGPLRFDVAFPLNGRDVDDTFEIYISLGQAF